MPSHFFRIQTKGTFDVYKLNPEFKEKWTAALESGDYVQGHGYLATQNDSHESWKNCCLGVACRLVGHSNDSLKGQAVPTENMIPGVGLQTFMIDVLWRLNDGFFAPDWEEDGEEDDLEDISENERSVLKTLRRLNPDGQPLTFNEIAHIIRTEF